MMVNFKARFLSIFMLLGFLSACVSHVVVDVNAISDPQVTDYGKRYYLTNVNDGAAANDLYFQEFRRYFDYILQKQGFIVSESRDEADIEIQFHYGISDGTTGVQTYSWPIYETFGGHTITVTENITDASGNTRSVQRTMYVPAYVQRVGSTYETRSYTIYNRYVNLAALPITKVTGQPVTPVWSANIQSIGESNDLRAIMPYLAAASMPFLGRNSGRQQTIKLRHDDPLIVELRGLVVNAQ
ncbi:MAG: hypothetical protein AMJ55_07585 [Gammaproteobacteria bacterium SG8_15]|nr:MAG: hypothetical protein AMJ55_07585 [Gammaproteobacteria bacterium SG8_15]